MRRGVGILSLIVATALPAPVASATAPDAQQAIDRLNAQRAANGLPAGITEDTTAPWSQRCALHDHYMALNGIGHEEKTDKRGYTAEGALAGQSAVLAQGSTWDSGNPYETAPVHLDQLLAPRLLTTGSADREGYSCTTTFPGWTGPAPAALTVYTYPGNQTTTIYPSETASELPWTPGDLVGIPNGTTTGPYLYVFADAPGQPAIANPVTLTGATLTDASGNPVPTKTVDGNTPTPQQRPSDPPTLKNYIAPSGFIIPLQPLGGRTTYRAHVVVGFAGVQTPYDWSFTTTGLDPQSSLTANGKTLAFSSRSSAAIAVALTRANGAHAPSLTIAPSHSAAVVLDPGTWQACGHQDAAAGFNGYDQCVTITVTGVPSLSFAKPALRGKKVKVALRFSPALTGRQASLKITSLTLTCRRGKCRTKTGRSSTRTIILDGTPLSFAIPSKGHGTKLTLTTSPFQLADAPWTGASASAGFFRRAAPPRRSAPHRTGTHASGPNANACTYATPTPRTPPLVSRSTADSCVDVICTGNVKPRDLVTL
jgi:hypothetical protein